MLLFLTEKPDYYELSMHSLAIETCCSVQYLEKLIDELQSYGYIDYELININGLVDGKFTIYDSPHEVTMHRYDFKQDFIKSISKAEKNFIREYLNPQKHKKRSKKISSYMEDIQRSIVDWDKIFEYINSELTYDEFLNTEYWLIISQYLKHKYNFICQDCKKKFSTFSKLNVHHKTYENHGREHMESVQNSDLVVLCEQCHKNRHCNDPQFEKVV